MESYNDNDIENRPKWSWWELFLVILSLISLMAFVAMFKKPIRGLLLSSGLEREYMETVVVFVSTLLQAAVIIISVFAITMRKGANLGDLGLKDSSLLRNIYRGLVGGVILGVTIWGIGIIYTLIAGPPPPQEVERIFSGVKTGKDLILPFIAIAILAPLSEELYFRAMVYPVFRARFGPIPGMIYSGIFFGSLHLDLYRVIPISVGGAVLAYFYEKTGSLTAPVIAHATWNSLMLLSYYLLAVKFG